MNRPVPIVILECRCISSDLSSENISVKIDASLCVLLLQVNENVSVLFIETQK
jgi:hypothetical protein